MGSADYQFFYFVETYTWFQRSYIFETFYSLDLHFQFTKIFVQLLSCIWLLATPWTAVSQAFLSFTVSQNLLKFMFIDSVMPSNHLILCHPLLLLPPLSQHQALSQCVYSLRQVAKVLELQLQHQSFQWISGLISFRIDWFDLLESPRNSQESSVEP